THASDYALHAVLSQVNDSENNPIAFDSRKLLPAELNYEINEKELLGILWALKCWGAFLLSLSNSFEAGCFTRCLVTLGRPEPRELVDFIRKNPQNFHQLIKKDGIKESRFFSIKVEIFSHLVAKIQKEVWKDKDYKEILKQLARGESVTDYSLEPQAKLLLFKDRVEKTLKLIQRDFYWAGMNQFIKDYVSLFVERLSKLAIFIPTYGTITSLELAQIFISHVFSKDGLPVTIVSDRGSLFVSSFWTNLCQQLKISRDLSTAFRPETDGQTERVNHIIEQYLWINPSLDSIHISQDSHAGTLSTRLQSVHQVVKKKLESAIRRFKKYADRNRSIPPDFQPGDKVWLASKSIKNKRPTKKLSEILLGPFEVLKKIGSHAYHLKLPQQWKSVHPVFHVSLLEPVKQSSIPNFNQLPSPPVLAEEQEEWEVAHVLDSKLKRGKLWYLVEGKGYSEDPERTTWEPASNLTNSPNIFKNFHSLYPDNPGLNTSRV
ncbi:hypothetical protein O181_008435, partial [Austropuccinia psidii MF-1]|nr:hypothetical protein [Austropuccinia psidii MF-1]